MAQLDRIRVASTCPISWEQMTGDTRVRICTECRLHVYNFAELTRTEAEDLLRTTEGRLCGPPGMTIFSGETINKLTIH